VLLAHPTVAASAKSIVINPSLAFMGEALSQRSIGVPRRGFSEVRNTLGAARLRDGLSATPVSWGGCAGD
jgi:hypothetical protein